LNSAKYFTTPGPIPPPANTTNRAVRLINCPSCATPSGPALTATNFITMKPESRRAAVAIAVRTLVLSIFKEKPIHYIA
jgi:hypothetical protein